MFKRILLALLAASASLHAITPDEIKERGYLKVAIYTEKPPFGYTDAAGQYQGFDIELAKQLAQDLLGDAQKIQLIPTASRDRIPLLKAKEADIVVAIFTQTARRAKAVDFTEPYLNVALGVLSPDKASIRSMDDLKGKIVLVNEGTTADNFLQDHYPHLELKRFKFNRDALKALQEGEGAALVHDSMLLLPWAKDNEGYSVSIPVLGEYELIGIGLAKGQPEWRDWLNQELKSLKNNGVLHRIYEQTLRPVFGDDVSEHDLLAP